MRRALIFTFAGSTLIMHFILPYAAMAEEQYNEVHENTHPPLNNSEKIIITTARPFCKKAHADTILIEELPRHIETEVSENELEELDEHLFVFFYTSKFDASDSAHQILNTLAKLIAKYHLQNFTDSQHRIPLAQNKLDFFSELG